MAETKAVEQKKVERPKSATAVAAERKEVVKGKAFYLLKAAHYRDGTYYPAGALISVEDEVPSKTWVRVKPVKGATFVPKSKPAEEPAYDEESEYSDVVVPEEDGKGANPGGTATSSLSPGTDAKKPTPKPNDRGV